MIASRHIDRAVLILVLLALLAAVLLPAAMGTDGQSVHLAYEEALFDTDAPLTVNILISEDEWQELLDTATSETYYRCDIEINGETYYSVGIRAKGNTSLTMVASSDSDRYSLKVKFDEYVSGQTCMGLDKLVLNNNYADATMMKEALTYDLFAFLDADASLYNYAAVSINGEYWGVYLALEAVEESFALRNYGTNYGQLYKPDSMDMGGAGKMKDVGLSEVQDLLDEAGGGNREGSQSLQLPGGEQDGMFGGGGFGSTGSSASLNYIDSDLSSYSTIWESSVFDSSDADHRRVVTALQNISQGTELEKYLDVDNMLRFLAVHTFVVNLDSLTGSMAHNYYLYEEDGALNMIPWDYNLAFGGFMQSSASTTVNLPIDTPFSGVSEEDRQFFMALLEVEEYLELYHSYLDRLVEEYVYGGGLDAFYTRTRSQIDTLVESDPTAFYTYEEYDQAAEMLYDTVCLRAESVRGQLAGTIPSTTQGQQEDSGALIDASSLDLSVMGVMNAGGGRGNMEDSSQRSGEGTFSHTSAFSSVSETEDQTPSGEFDGEVPGDLTPPSGMDLENMPEQGFPSDGQEPDRTTQSIKQSGTAGSVLSGAVTLALCALLMIGALFLTKLFRRPRRGVPRTRKK